MAKKNNKQKQQQKRVEKKREKRLAPSRPKRFPMVNGPELVSTAFLANCWSLNALPAPPTLLAEVQAFDRWAESFLDVDLPEEERLPSRFDLLAVVLSHLKRAISPGVLDDIARWLGRSTDSPVQRQRIKTTLEALDRSWWPSQNSILQFLLEAWFAEFPPGLSRWLQTWVDPFPDGPWPEIPTGVVRALAAQDDIPFQEVAEGELVEILSMPDAYELLLDIGAIYGWTVGPPDYVGILATLTLWRWASRHDATSVGERARQVAPEVHPRLTLFHAATHMARSIRSELGVRWDEFACDPQSPDWVLDLAEKLRNGQKSEDAYQLLQKMAARLAENVDVHEKLADLALDLGLPPETVMDHVRCGRAALQAQGDDIDPEIRDEYRSLFASHLARLLAPA